MSGQLDLRGLGRRGKPDAAAREHCHKCPGPPHQRPTCLLGATPLGPRGDPPASWAGEKLLRRSGVRPKVAAFTTAVD